MPRSSRSNQAENVNVAATRATEGNTTWLFMPSASDYNVNNNDRNTNAVRNSAPLFDRINGGYNRGGYRGGGGRGGGYRGGGGRGRSRYVHY